MLRSYAKPITKKPKPAISYIINLRGTKAIWQLLRIMMYGVVSTSLQQGLTQRTAFWLESKTKSSALESLFPVSVEAEERSL